MHRLIAPLAIVASISAPAFATDRYYDDSTATSPSGRYRIDAKSPDNAGPRPRPFASNFTYALTDTKTNKVVWERKQPMKREKGSTFAWPEEPSPTSVFVTDEGLVVASLAGESIIVLDPADGHKRGEARILASFPRSEQDDFVSMSTAGPIWEQNSDWFFVQTPAAGTQPQQTLFVVRPYWNHRQVIDCATASHVDLGVYHSAASPDELKDADGRVKRVLDAVMTEEVARARAALKDVERSLKDPENYAARWALGTAVFTVGFRNLADLEPQLRALELRLATLPDETRLAGRVRETLRRIGKVPKPGCGVLLYGIVDMGAVITDDRNQPLTAVVPTETRTQNAPKIAAGMTMKQVCDLIGCPDAELYDQGFAFDYDIDAQPPYTLRIVTSSRQTVGSVRTITPFAFLHDKPRMRGR